jgi:hypothetical protein
VFRRCAGTSKGKGKEREKGEGTIYKVGIGFPGREDGHEAKRVLSLREGGREGACGGVLIILTSACTWTEGRERHERHSEHGHDDRRQLETDSNGVHLKRPPSRIPACTMRNSVGVRRSRMEPRGGRRDGH